MRKGPVYVKHLLRKALSEVGYISKHIIKIYMSLEINFKVTLVLCIVVRYISTPNVQITAMMSLCFTLHCEFIHRG